MAAVRKHAEPPRPAALKRYPDAWWDAQDGVWRDGDYWYDERVADAAVSFFATHLCLTEGQWAGKPFILEPWQENDIVRPTFGWKRADGTRRYRRVYIWVARKNGKTELAAGMALLMLLGDAEPAGQVYSIAADKAQASLVFDKAAKMAAYSPTLGRLLECLKPAIYCPSLNASFRPLSGKPQGKHGLSMSGLVGDEIHEWPNGDLYTFVHDSSAARRQPLEVLISTAGVSGSHGEEVWNECQAILKGEVEAPDTLVVIYAADPEDDWTDPATWAKANPNLGVSLKLEEMAAACRLAQQIPRLENDFKRYRLNIWTDQAVRWLPIAAVDDEGRKFGWDLCVGPTPWQRIPEALAGRGLKAYGGLDLSATQDLSALVWWFPVQPGLEMPVVLPRFFKPADLLKVHGKRDKLPYAKWAQGEHPALFGTPGNVIDYAFIKAQIFRDAEAFDVQAIAIDRWNATQLAIELQQEDLPVEFMGQGFASLSNPSKELERLVTCNGFEHGGHPLLRKHAQVVAVATDAADNIKPLKTNRTLRIDGIAGLVNALAVALKGVEEPDPEVIIL